MGEMGEMEKNGGEMGGNGELAGIAHGVWVVEGCGVMWSRKMGQNGTTLGEKWHEIPIFHSSISPMFPEVEDPLHSSLCRNQFTALTDGKMGMFATHRHSPPQRLVRMLEPRTKFGVANH